MGNVTKARVDELAGLLKQHVRISDVAPVSTMVIELEGASSMLLGIDHNDASMVLYVQDERSSFENRARSTLLTHLVSPGFFSSLRTEQQLGYVVSAVNTQLRDRGGISFVIQSPVAGPDILRDRTLAFMTLQERVLSEMSDEEFGANKGGLNREVNPERQKPFAKVKAVLGRPGPGRDDIRFQHAVGKKPFPI